jgi:NAD(P)-dependent dehydrogenase (short-subunit alcohol dehydrogenase family)
MSDLLIGKKALVTGGSRGIGLAVARALLASGADVAICGRQQQHIDAALSTLHNNAPDRKIVGQVADVSDSAQVSAFFQFVDRELGGLDILVNNAGLGIFRSTAELTVAEWDQVIGANLSGAFYCSREALERFGRSKGGFIINISSLAGRNAFAGGSAYNASKFALTGFSEAMMLDHRNDNVRVSYIMPGSVDTEFGGVPDKKSHWKIAPDDIAEIVIAILRMPARTLISRVEVRPSRPQKS